VHYTHYGTMGRGRDDAYTHQRDKVVTALLWGNSHVANQKWHILRKGGVSGLPSWSRLKVHESHESAMFREIDSLLRSSQCEILWISSMAIMHACLKSLRSTQLNTAPSHAKFSGRRSRSNRQLSSSLMIASSSGSPLCIPLAHSIQSPKEVGTVISSPKKARLIPVS
jgi:hypothetical protein